MPIRADLGLSEGMRAALLDALRMELNGLHFVICHEATRRALVVRGLAVRERAGLDHRTVLTDLGKEEAAAIRAETAPSTGR
ncbi:hypothetical protein [Actinomadura bangladeshensis]|uniref:Uncharacterized protein n=1 Tax=Actinomadura bangladeshensis TaxID=453573 RepID=A0A6L9QDB6_9ACTN|nr:hypothetical protein [Actinomadura bangladeshensis]NEA22663.1 hypothetical protein [Actinomadura bangladeshensis]